MKKLLIIAILLLSAGLLLADTPTDTATPTQTMTSTETLTPTISATIAETSTITQTYTITPTFTITPTPQAKAFAFPNPAKNTNEIGFAYPIESGKTAQMATIIIKAVNGEEAGRAYDPTPNGYTYIDISKYARGVYMYQIIIHYTDGTDKKYPIDKLGRFAVIK